VLASHAEKKGISLETALGKALRKKKENYWILPSMGDWPPPCQKEIPWTSTESSWRTFLKPPKKHNKLLSNR